MKKIWFFAAAAALLLAMGNISAMAAQQDAANDIQVEIVSPDKISSQPIYEGSVEIRVTNTGNTEADGLSCYLSVVDVDRKQSFAMDEFGEDAYQTRELSALAPDESTTVTIPLRVMYVGNFRLVANVLDSKNNMMYASNALETVMTATSSLNKPLVLTVSVIVPAALLALTCVLMKRRGAKAR